MLLNKQRFLDQFLNSVVMLEIRTPDPLLWFDDASVFLVYYAFLLSLSYSSGLAAFFGNVTCASLYAEDQAEFFFPAVAHCQARVITADALGCPVIVLNVASQWTDIPGLIH